MAEKKPYKAKSLSGAQTRVRQLEKLVEEYKKITDWLYQERRLLARLAAKGPAFFSPLEAMNAERARDKILSELGMNPDGSFKSTKQDAVANG